MYSYIVFCIQLVWGRLYNKESTRQLGTMYQLRNVICRNVVPNDPQKNMNAAEDFMLLLVHCHVIAAAHELMQKKAHNMTTLAKEIIDTFVHFPDVSQPGRTTPESDDNVHLYATELLSLGLLWHGFHDAVKEADGNRILRYWKLLLVPFKSSGHRNYAKEAVNVLFQYHYVFSERQRMQLLWSRCINTKGHKGANIPCDLYMEHLNRRLKTVVRGMGSNVSPSKIQRAGETLQPIQNVCETFEKQTASQLHTDRHPYPSFKKDFKIILSTIVENKVFSNIPGRNHPSFKFKKSIFELNSRSELIKKVNTTLKKLV